MSGKSFIVIGLLVLAMVGNFACADADARTLTPVPAAAGSAAKSDKPDVGASVTQNDQAAVVAGNSQFAFDLYAKLRTTEGNLFFSPYSISTALAMTYAGARGSTEKQMAGTMHFALDQKRLHPTFGALIADLNSRSGKGHEILVANALWGQQGYRFLKPFLDLTRTHYDSGLNEVNFATATEAARKKINAWVEKKTRRKIKELIKSGVLDTLTRLVLTNAIYFKGNWASQFQEARTASGPFTLATGDKIKALMMNQSGEFRYYEEKYWTRRAGRDPHRRQARTLPVESPQGQDHDLVSQVQDDLAVFAWRCAQGHGHGGRILQKGRLLRHERQERSPDLGCASQGIRRGQRGRHRSGGSHRCCHQAEERERSTSAALQGRSSLLLCHP